MAAGTGVSVCARIAKRIESAVGQGRFHLWFEQSTRLVWNESRGCLQVQVPNGFMADYMTRHYQREIRQAIQAELGTSVDIQVQVAPEAFQAGGGSARWSDSPGRRTDGRGVGSPAGSPASAGQGRARADAGRHVDEGADAAPRADGDDAAVPTAAAALGAASGAASSADRRAGRPAPRSQPVLMKQPVRSPGGHGALPLRHRLEDFIVGPSNELAFAAARRLVDYGPSGQNPLFVHGGCGLGKTHLLQGVCQAFLEEHPRARVLYTTAEAFTNAFLAAVKANAMGEFRARIRKLDLLAVDDLHFLANKQATQREFQHSFDAIDLSGSRVVLASDSHPRAISQFSDALVSRMIRGMVVEIREPDTHTRARIVQALATRRGIPLLDTVVDVIAARCVGSVRDLEGTLTRLHALSELVRDRGGLPIGDGGETGAIGHALVDRLFQAETTRPARRAVTFEHIVRIVAEHIGVTSEAILGSGRARPVVLARSLTIHLARLLTPLSYPEIAARMGRRSHSTVVTADARIKAQIRRGDPVLVPAMGRDEALPALLETLRSQVLAA